VIRQGDYISIDGSTGFVFVGAKKLTSVNLGENNELATLMKWADEINETRVFVNANTPVEIGYACLEGIEAIGLCRTEWMFHDVSFRPLFRESLLAESEHTRSEALRQLRQLQANEFETIFTRAGRIPVIVRLLAHPVDNFLPVRDVVVTELAELRWSQGWNELVGRKEQLLQKTSALQQVNPRFGMRGVRIFFAMPELAAMQVRALFEGACRAAKNSGKARPSPWILLPNVISSGEVSAVKHLIREVAVSVMKEAKIELSYQIGALIETPRAAITAGEIASLVDFMYLGTDGLTESVFGYAREDGTKFVPAYISHGVLPNDPLMWFDTVGVGALMKLAVQEARKAHPDIKLGICGSHVHDINAIHFYGKLGLDYVCADLSYLLDLRLALAQVRVTQE
jgi:pyruvate,orthophosphate dikinase